MTVASSGGRRRRSGFLPPSFYVATNGNNAWTGLLDAPNAGSTDGPFLTLAAAQTAARASGTIKRVTIRTGTYTLGANLAFTSSDNGCTWVRYANEVAVIDGSSSTFKVTGTVNNFVMKGLVFQNLLGSNASGGAGIRFVTCSSLTFRWNTVQNISTGWMVQLVGVTGSSLIDSNTFTGQSPGNFNGIANGYACVQITSSSNVTLSHNLFTNNAAAAITKEGAQNNIVYDRNICDGCCNNADDLGALYGHSRASSDTGFQITNNIVRNGGTGHNGRGIRGIYIDDDQSNTTISGNLLYDDIGVIAIQLSHFVNTGGSVNNVASNNIFAIKPIIDDAPPQTVWYNIETPGYQGGGTGNVFNHNIMYYYTTAHNPAWTTFGSSPPTPPTVSNNIYFSQTGQTISNAGSIVDSNRFLEDPLFVSPGTGDFRLQSGSPAYAHLSWVDQPIDQGPLAYVSEGIIPTQNQVRNSRLAGGVAGSPGTMPTNCSVVQGVGLTRTLTFGVDGTTGFNYMDIRFNGTPAAGSVLIVLENQATVTALAQWTDSVYWALAPGSGAMTGVTGRSLVADFSNSSGTYISTLGTSQINPTATLTRISNVATSPATAGRSNLYIEVDYSAVAINFTLRIEAPQIEVGAVATTFQATP